MENTVYVAIRGSVDIFEKPDGTHIKSTVYFSVPVKVTKLKLNKNDCHALFRRATEIFFSSGTSSVSKLGNLHPHRSIDEMRMHHSFHQRMPIYQTGSTVPGKSPFFVWAAAPVSGPNFDWPKEYLLDAAE